jgi:hypothetical protein
MRPKRNLNHLVGSGRVGMPAISPPPQMWETAMHFTEAIVDSSFVIQRLEEPVRSKVTSALCSSRLLSFYDSGTRPRSRNIFGPTVKANTDFQRPYAD